MVPRNEVVLSSPVFCLLVLSWVLLQYVKVVKHSKSSLLYYFKKNFLLYNIFRMCSFVILKIQEFLPYFSNSSSWMSPKMLYYLQPLSTGSTHFSSKCHNGMFSNYEYFTFDVMLFFVWNMSKYKTIKKHTQKMKQSYVYQYLKWYFSVFISQYKTKHQELQTLRYDCRWFCFSFSKTARFSTSIPSTSSFAFCSVLSEMEEKENVLFD